MSRGGRDPGLLSGPRRQLRKSAQPERVIDEDGTERWLLDGNLHRKGAPAVVHPNGIEEWRRDGKLHREDGPALIVPADIYERVDYEYEPIKAVTVAALEGTSSEDLQLYGPGWAWFENGELHRSDGPAVEDTRRRVYGKRTAYYFRGALHREEGPALEILDDEDEGDSRHWYRHGQPHREDGPARIWGPIDPATGEFVGRIELEEYWVDGEELSEDEWKARTGR